MYIAWSCLKFNYSFGDMRNSDLGEGKVCLGEGSGGGSGGKGREVGEKGEASGGKGGGKWGMPTPLSTPSYMGMVAILFNGGEPFEQIGNTLSTEGPMSNLVKIAQAVSEKKTFKNNTILYMYIAQGQGQITPREQNFDYN